MVFDPDDPLFQRFRIRMQTEQGAVARRRSGTGKQTPLPFWVADALASASFCSPKFCSAVLTLA